MGPQLEDELLALDRRPSGTSPRIQLFVKTACCAACVLVVCLWATPRRLATPGLAASANGEGCATLIQTAKDSNAMLREMDCVMAEGDFEVENVVDITNAQEDQEIVGFGGAFTESSALVLQALKPELQDKIIEAYFSLEEGIGYTLGRVHINSCDFSVNSYSFDDVYNDFDLKYFDDTVAHDARTMIPFIHAAQEVAYPRKITMLASPWSPPAWMKTNGKMVGSDFPGLRPECRDVWARYISRWLHAYERYEVPIWGLTVQNEPENPARWEGCLYDAETSAGFVRDFLGPTLKKDHPNLKLFAFDHNKVRRGLGFRAGGGWGGCIR